MKPSGLPRIFLPPRGWLPNTAADETRQQQTVQQDRAEVLNRLYQFFSRHYQDGDFIVERRYGKGGSRYVRSTGEDTEFHWATEDMYYIASGDTTDCVRLANGRYPAHWWSPGKPSGHSRRLETQRQGSLRTG